MCSSDLWKHHRADVPTFHYARLTLCNPSLLLAHRGPNAWARRRLRSRLAYLRLADRLGHIPVVEDHRLPVQADMRLASQLLQTIMVLQGDVQFLGPKGHRPIHGARVYVCETKSFSDTASDRALARSGGSVDSNDDRS